MRFKIWDQNFSFIFNTTSNESTRQLNICFPQLSIISKIRNTKIISSCHKPSRSKLWQLCKTKMDKELPTKKYLPDWRHVFAIGKFFWTIPYCSHIWGIFWRPFLGIPVTKMCSIFQCNIQSTTISLHIAQFHVKTCRFGDTQKLRGI